MLRVYKRGPCSWDPDAERTVCGGGTRKGAWVSKSERWAKWKDTPYGQVVVLARDGECDDAFEVVLDQVRTGGLTDRTKRAFMQWCMS